MSESAKSKEQLRSEALRVCSDFLSDWNRVFSIVGLMEEAFNAEIKEAEDDTVDSYAAEQFSLNLYWLRQRLDASAQAAEKRLHDVGYGSGPRA